MSGGAWAICPRCWFRRRHSDLRQEWTTLYVCRECWDPRPAWLDPPTIDPLEGSPVPNARFDQDATNPTFTDDDNPVTPEDL